jgi:hypothetical protein
LLRLANIDRVFWIVHERLTVEAADGVHVFLSHPAGEFNDYFRPVWISPRRRGGHGEGHETAIEGAKM